MEQLGNAIGPLPKLAICTDACKGLEEAVKQVFPWAEQRECFRHLMENMKINFSGTEYGKYMWPAARAYTKEKHRYLLDKVLQNTPGLKAWLDKDHKLLWTRAKFDPDIKCDYITNNLAESWNSWIKEFKDLPLDSLADAVREKMVGLFETRRRISNALNGYLILPAVIHQLNADSYGLTNLRVTKGDPNQSEVTEIYKDEAVRRHVVHLNKHFCTCHQWQINGKPCPHAIAVLTTNRRPNFELFVHNFFSVQKFQAAYAGCVPVITDKEQWPEVDKGFKLFPPIAKPRGLGRQRKNRMLGPLERSGKAIRQSKCQNCGELGHRKGSWRCSLTGTKKRKRNAKKAGVKPGRKKAKANDTEVEQPTTASSSQMNTPRTRAAAAREAAATEAIAREAAAQALAREEAAQTSTYPTRRRLALESAPPQLEAPASPVVQPSQPAKKITPKRKILSSRIRKTPTKTG